MESRIGHLHDGIILLLQPEHLFVESGILGYGIRNTLKEMLNVTDDWNPESKGQLTNYWNPVRVIRNPQRGIQTLRLSRGSQWVGGVYGYRLKFWLF